MENEPLSPQEFEIFKDDLDHSTKALTHAVMQYLHFYFRWEGRINIGNALEIDINGKFRGRIDILDNLKFDGSEKLQ